MIDVSGMDAGQLEAVAAQAGGALDAAYQRYVRAYGKAPSICNDLHGIVAPPSRPCWTEYDGRTKKRGTP